MALTPKDKKPKAKKEPKAKASKAKKAAEAAASEVQADTQNADAQTTGAQNTGAQNGEAAAQQSGPMLSVLAQYTKDQSFENPNAPESLRSGMAAPEISINIEIGRQMMSEDTVEVVLMLRADARRGEQVAFIAELAYAGLFAFQNVNIEEIQPLILIECPRLLFPFARQIMATMTQNGGYPPIMLEPPDFAAMFREELMRRAAEQPTN